MSGCGSKRTCPGTTWRLAWSCVPLSILLLGLPAAAAQTVSGTVRRVLDGDTLIVQAHDRARLRCRLAGIDAPEVSHRRRDGGVGPGQPFGPEAKTALEGMVLRRRVTAEIHAHDRYRRPLCLLWIGSRNVNLALVREGYAWAERGDSADVPADLRWEVLVAEDAARRTWRGLWREPDPEPPWTFRRRVGSPDR